MITRADAAGRPAPVTSITGDTDDRRAVTRGDPAHRGARLWRRVEGAGPRVALTFDDGDSAPAWDRILDALRAHAVAATFFALGMRAEQFPMQARRTVAEGHGLGSHGWDHTRLVGIGEEAIGRRLRADAEVWGRLTGSTPTPYLRPPYGDLDDTVRSVAAGAGYTEIVLWDVDPLDWTLPGPGEITRRVAGAVRPGSIVELHVTEQTAAALPDILRRLDRAGLACVPLPALLP